MTSTRATALFLPLAALLATAVGVGAQSAPLAPVMPTSWARAELPDAPSGSELFDVAAGDAGFVAVGGGFPEGGEAPVPGIWSSPDGASWSPAVLTGTASVGQPRAVLALADGGFLAAGGRCCPDQALVWRSADGVAWELAPDDPVFADAAILALAQSADGSVVAVGCRAVMECGGGLAWRSADGVTWGKPVELGWLPFAIAATDIGLVAAGATEPYLGSPVVATSPDGLTWTSLPLPPGTGALYAAEAVPGGALLAGATTDPDTLEATSLVVLVTAAGAAPQLSVALPGNTIEDLAWLGGDPADGLAGLVLAGWRSSADGEVPATWSSSDGVTWDPGAFPREMKAGGLLHGVEIAPDGTAVVVGSSVLNRGVVPTIWVSPAAPG